MYRFDGWDGPISYNQEVSRGCVDAATIAAPLVTTAEFSGSVNGQTASGKVCGVWVGVRESCGHKVYSDAARVLVLCIAWQHRHAWLLARWTELIEDATPHKCGPYHTWSPRTALRCCALC